MRMTKKELASICSLLIAGAAFGAVTTNVVQTFESTFTVASPWFGSGTPTEGTAEMYSAITAGTPVPVTSNYYLAIDDSVICSNTVSGTSAILDMMVQASVPDELDFPEGDGNGVQIAIGVDKIDGDAEHGKLKVWCTPKNSSEPAWCELQTVETDTWHRVTFVFDYSGTTKYAQVRIDGQPVMTANGCLTTTTAGDTGAWYKLATPDASALNAVQIVGSTGLDQFLLTSGNMDEIKENCAVAGSTGGILNSWFDKYGLGWDTTKTYDDSGLTLEEKYEAGLNPLNGDKLEIKAIAMSADKATFTIPQTAPATGKAVKLFSATSSNFSDKDQGTAVSGTTVTLDLPGANAPVKYYRLETVNE